MRFHLIYSGLLCTFLVGSATAGINKNGGYINGVQPNGVQPNGVQPNGVQPNGVQPNGMSITNVSISGVSVSATLSSAQVNGTKLTASFIGSGSCAHREDVTGTALPAGCSACATIVTNADPYCKTTSWDSACVSRARSTCVVDNYKLVNQPIKISFTDGSWATAYISNVTAGSSSVDHDKDTRTPNLSMSDVLYNTMYWSCSHSTLQEGSPLSASCSSIVQQVCSYDSYCCNNWWDGQCVGEATGTAGATREANGPICGITRDTNGDGVADAAGRGMFLAGAWNYDSGYDGAGGRSSSSTTKVMFACENTGAIGKCVNQGYKPWASSAASTLHQTCVRMIRGDYCGDGMAWTKNGQPVDVGDYVPYQQVSDSNANCICVFEATWKSNGASTMNYYRYRDWADTSFKTWYDTHPYCQSKISWTSSYVPVVDASNTQNGIVKSLWYGTPQ